MLSTPGAVANTMQNCRNRRRRAPLQLPIDCNVVLACRKVYELTRRRRRSRSDTRATPAPRSLAVGSQLLQVDTRNRSVQHLVEDIRRRQVCNLAGKVMGHVIVCCNNSAPSPVYLTCEIRNLGKVSLHLALRKWEGNLNGRILP